MLFTSAHAQTSKFEPFKKVLKEWLQMKGDYDYETLIFDFIEEGAVPITFESFLENQNWKVEHSSLYYYINSNVGRLTWPRRKSLFKTSQAPHREELKTSQSYYFLTKGDRKLIVNIYGNYVYVYYNPTKKESYKQALDFKKEYLNYFAATSPFKGKALEYTGEIKFLKSVDELNSNWKQFIFPKNQKVKIQNTIDNFIGKYNEADWTNYKLPHSRGVILYGPPGTGKSFIANILISNVLKSRYQNKVTYIHVQSRNIRYSEDIRNIYQVARKYSPSIVFFEDIDLISGTDRNDQAEIKNELMQQLSGLEELKGVITIGTTNYFDRIDYALKRSKRLGFHFEIGTPTFTSREKLFKLFLSKKQLAVRMDNIDFIKLAQISEGLTGADIKEITDLAIQSSIEVNGDITSFNITQKLLEETIIRKAKNKI